MSTSTAPTRSAPTGSRRYASHRALLLRQRQQQLADIAAMSQDSFSAPMERYDEHRVDDLHVATQLTAAAWQQLKDTEAALARIDAGTYGLCGHCHEPIPPERLEVLPAAGYCITCQATLSAGWQP